ncbi:MAG TPA: hypothetical protein VFA27_03325 [Vicinamibacterales bacterium]|nr:hypothetical protein [Vicinamibacterales bacterium]
MLPAPVRRFLQRSIDSIEHLEIVLLLQHHRTRTWTGADVATALQLSPRAAAADLETLAQRSLLDVRIDEDVRYRFAPATPELTAVLKQVAECYRDRRGEVVAAVANRRQALRDFSDAFRIRKDRQDG